MRFSVSRHSNKPVHIAVTNLLRFFARHPGGTQVLRDAAGFDASGPDQLGSSWVVIRVPLKGSMGILIGYRV